MSLSEKILSLKKIYLIFLTSIIVSLSPSLFFAEKLVKFVNPQLTFNEAQKLSPQIYKKSDYLPFELKSDVSTVHTGHTYEFTYTVKTNSLGYRMREFKMEKEPDEFRILMLGDSMTFGYGVEVEQNLPSILESRLNEYISEIGEKNKRITVINAAFADGRSPDTYYLYLKRRV